MQEFKEMLLKRQSMLIKCVARAEGEIRDDLEGHLLVSGTGKRSFFYHFLDTKEARRRYIPKKEMDYIKALAANDYAARVLRLARRELRALERYIGVLGKGTAEGVYSRMSPARRRLIKPLMVSDEVLAEWWAQEHFVQSAHMPEKKIYPTKKGDMVRSKSEVLFADMYLDMGLPYRYEQVLELRNGTSAAPDFTMWDRKNRREIYHEHLGLMDDPEYRLRALRKIDDYRRSGIYVGKNLILTFEGDGAVLNMREMRKMMEEIFG